MSDHSLAFVPVGTGYVQSTDLFARRRPVDTGLLAEALIYFDRLFINVETPDQFAQLVSWLIQQGLSVANIIALFQDGVFNIYDFAFTTNPFVTFQQPSQIQIHDLLHFQDPAMAAPNSFTKRYLEHGPLRDCFDIQSQFELFVKAVEDHVIEVKADDVGAGPIQNAYSDFVNPERNSLMTQQLVNEIYRVKRLGKPPRVEAYVSTLSDGGFNVSWNIRLNELPAVEIDTQIVAAATLPLSTAAQANKYLWACERQNCDLYLARPVSVLVGDKLFEAAEVTTQSKLKSQNVIESLQMKVEFPDVRRYVNEDKIDFPHVLQIRKKAERFRQWLQSEGDRERDVMIAYLSDVAKASGFSKVARRTLKMFGVLGGAALGAKIGADPSVGAALGAAGGAMLGKGAGEAVKYMFELGSNLGVGWKPVVFGDWYREKIERLLEEQHRS